ncbi:MAG: S8 family serine peptidase, partial [Gammaproteobacteria bacterium]|nr:S8 family serine peptidase [Gammaproteobacteria bacterium]
MRIKYLLATLVLGCVLAATGSVVAQDAAGTLGEKNPADQRPFIDPELKTNLEARGTATSLVYLREEADLSPALDMGWEERGWFVYNTLKEVADRSQAALKGELDSMGADYRSFWIDNVIAIRNTDNQILNMLASRPDVARVIQEPVGFIPEPPANLTNDDNQIQAVVDSLVQINVPDVWALGYTGQGADVGIIDSGTRYTHDALVSNYRGNLGGGSFDHNYNWFDVGGTTEPVWPNPHGSHVTGTAVGDDGGDNQIGAAPGAEWVSCLGCTSTSCPGANLLACGEFMAAPTDLAGNNPDPSQRVHVVNNSWGDCGQTYDGWYQGVVDGWIAAGVVPIVSNGNASNCGYSSPPGPNTVGNPARYGTVLGIGSSGNSNGQYASHSNWGPTDNPNDGTDPALPDPMGYPDLKPNVIAPGVAICSVNSNGGDSGYTCGFTGTSMSAPAASGVIALMISAAPSLAGDFATLGTVLMQTATPIDYDSGVGGEGPGNVPNYATGWGEIDALAAVQGALAAAGPRGTLTGTVTDLDTSNPIAGVTVSTEDFETPPNPISTTTDAAGNYSLSLPETETGQSYDIEFSRNGYQTAVVTGLTITDDETITLDQQLQAVAGETVSGQVTDANFPGTGIEGAELLFTDGDDFTYGPATTDGSGNYSIDLPPGLTYDVTISAEGYETLDDNIGEVSGPTTADFALNAGIVELPATASLTLDRGTQDSTTITINNTGTADAEVMLGTGGTGSEFFEQFQGSFPPDGWTVEDDAGSGCIWLRTDDVPMDNYAGTGQGAAANSDECGSGITVDTSLVSPAVDLSASTTAQLDLLAVYRHLGSSFFAVDVTTNGGTTWTNELTWDSDQNPTGPGIPVSIDLDAYTGNSAVQVRFRYSSGWDWWANVDDVDFTHDNVGVPWIQVDPMTVTVPQGGSVDVDLNVDASDLAAGVYNVPIVVKGGSAYPVTPTDFEVTVDPVPEIILPETVDITVEYPNTTSETIDVQNVGGLSGDVTLDFNPNGINEDFEGTFPPEGWTLVDNSSPACPWSTTDQTTPPGWPAGGTRAAIADSDDCGSGIQADTALISPPIDFSSVTGSINLDFDFAYRSGFEDSTVTLLVSGDGGDTWDVIDSWTDGDDVAYPTDPTAPLSYDLGAYAGSSEVLIQWHYEAGWSWWTIVDNVQIQPPPVLWANANPALVTVPASDTAQTDIDIDSSVLPGPGVYQASMNGSVDSPFPVESTLVTLTVEPGPDLAGINGTVESLGYCGSNPFAAAGAAIEIVGVNNTYNTTADENGFYEIFIPSDETPVDITASAPNHLDGTQTGVALTPADSITVDFSLDLDEPCVDTAPASFSSTLEIGNSDTQTLTIGNTDGAGQLDWTLEEAEPTSGSAGPHPLLGAVASGSSDLMSSGAVQPAGEPERFPRLIAPQGGTLLTQTGDNDILEANSVACPTGPNFLYRRFVMDDHPEISGGVQVNSVEFGVQEGVVDQTITATLYSIPKSVPENTIDISQLTEIGTADIQVSPADDLTWVVVDAEGTIADTANNDLVVEIAATGADPFYIGATDSSESRPGFVAAENCGITEPTTVVSIGPDFENTFIQIAVNAQSVGGSGCTSPSDVSWLSYSSTSGSVAAGGSEDVDVILDSTGLNPGTYEASVCVNSNDPENGVVAVPVTLEATAPASFASVSGTVQSLGYCSSDPFAAAGASVEIVSGAQTYNLTADGSGFYELFLDSAEGPVDVTATAPDHDSQSVTGIALTPGENEVVDFDLILQQACATVNPASLSDTINDGSMVDYTVTVGNADGAVDLDWSLDIDEPMAAYQPGLPEAGVFTPAPNGWDRAAGQPAAERDGRAPSAEAGLQGGPIGDFSEGFADITTLPGAGWSLQNLSDPLGTIDWFQGNDTVFPAQDGPPTSYIAANFNNTSGGTGTISNWLLTPEVELNEGTTLSFWTRTGDGSTFPDRMEVRMSTAGSSTDVGAGATDVGDFTELMLTINEGLTVGGYPETWTEYVIEVTGVPSGASGRFGFRYFVTDAGPDGVNSNYIGIDTVSVAQPEACVNPMGSSWLSVDTTNGTVTAGDTQDVTVT